MNTNTDQVEDKQTEEDIEAVVHPILAYGAVEMATQIGYGAAGIVSFQLGPDEPTFQPSHWPSLGLISEFEEDETGQSKANALGAYVCERVARGMNVQPEQLFRKALSLGIHDTPGAAWPDLDLHLKLPFELFAEAVGLAFNRLSQAQADEEKRIAVANRPKPAPVPIEDTIHEQEEPLGAVDPDRVKANELAAKAQKEKAERGKAETETAEPLSPADGAEAADQVPTDPNAEPPMSVGEKPPAVTGNKKRGGSRKKKTDK